MLATGAARTVEPTSDFVKESNRETQDRTVAAQPLRLERGARQAGRAGARDRLAELFEKPGNELAADHAAELKTLNDELERW